MMFMSNERHSHKIILMCMSMLTLNEADNKEILYTLIDIDFRYSLIVYSKLVSCALISKHLCLWPIGTCIITVARKNDLLIFLGYENITAANNEVKC